MAETERTRRVEETSTQAQQDDEDRAQQTPVSRTLANPRRIRRA